MLLAIYIIYMRNNTPLTDNEKNLKKVNIRKDIIIGITEFDTLNPITTKSLEMQYISKLIYRPLIEITQDFNTETGLAKECSKTGQTEYIVKLDESKWQNGSNVTTRDIEFTINTIKNTDSIYKQNVEKIEEMDILDDQTIKFKLSEETSFFEYLLCIPIVKENTYDNEYIGTGRYKVEEIKANEIILKSEDRKIIIKIYDSVAEMYSEFTKEKIDLLITQNNEYNEYIGNIGFSEQLITGRNYYYLTFNNKLEKEIKNQIKKSINREQIIYDLYNNKYKIANFPLEYGSYLNNNIGNLSNESEKTPQQIVLGVSNDEELYKIAEQIKTQLEERNIETIIQYYDNYDNAITSDYYNCILNKKIVDITPKIDYYFKQTEMEKNIVEVYEIEDKNVLKEEYNKIIEQYERELPFIGLFFDSYIILHNSKLKGDFSGNWYNPFYNIDTWYKVE